MAQRYFAEPYTFIPPCRSTWFANIAQWVEPIYFPLALNVHKMVFEEADLLRESLKYNQGIMLACNHTSGCDPFILGKLAQRTGRWFHFLTSHHLFRQTALFGELLRRMGGYSIFRDGPDLASVKTTVELLRTGNRPILIFPEGTYFKHNDRLGPIQDGVGLILRQAIRHPVRPVVLHPLAIKYWFQKDPMPAIRAAWTELEIQKGIHGGYRETDTRRLERLIRLQMTDFFDEESFGNEDEPLETLIFLTVGQRLDALTGLNEFQPGLPNRETLWQTIRKYRQTLVKNLVEEAGKPMAEAAIQVKLADLLSCENVLSISIDYVLENPTPERIWETWARWEETITDIESRFPTPATSVVRVGPSFEVKKSDCHKGSHETEAVQGEPVGANFSHNPSLDPNSPDFGQKLAQAMREQLKMVCSKPLPVKG